MQPGRSRNDAVYRRVGGTHVLDDGVGVLRGHVGLVECGPQVLVELASSPRPETAKYPNGRANTNSR
jgi:hypothetical protein